MNASVDLATILIVAGITCLIFKKLKQPLVLGYIVAGFLTGPNFPYFVTVGEKENVEILANVGVILLMFSIGLEFSFYKLKKVGISAFIATAVAVTGMVLLGFSVGHILGFTTMECMFLGCMLGMSSTAIIFKAFEDMELKEKKFAGLVLGVLIIEDIVGIIMMVVLTTIATAAADVSTLDLLANMGKLGFCLILWFVLGMYLIPSIFKGFSNLFNDETLVVFSIGLCLAMVVIAEYAGFSSALGAFIMGSLIAEAPQAERIEQLVQPLKNIFAAVFFVSVGMLVDPAALVEYAIPIAILIVLTIAGQITCGTLGMLAGGQSLQTAVRSGFCFCQIGEFSFILAALGADMGVTRPFLYPVIVAVSVFTTFTTPTFIGMAVPAYAWLTKHLPAKVLHFLTHHNNDSNDNNDHEWFALLKSYATRMLIFSVLIAALDMACEVYLIPYLTKNMQIAYANYIIAFILFMLEAPLFGILMRGTAYTKQLAILWYKRRANHIPIIALLLGKVLLAWLTLFTLFHILADLDIIPSLIAIFAASYFIAKSTWLRSLYLRLESRFLVNMNEKHVMEHRNGVTTNVTEQLDQKILICSYNVDQGSPLLGKSLQELNFHQRYMCNIVRIGTKNSLIYMPGGQDILQDGSRFTIIGTEQAITIYDLANTQQRLCTSLRFPPVTLKEYMLDDTIPKDYRLFIYALPLQKCPSLIGKAIRSSQLRDKWNCMVVGLQRGAYNTVSPDVNTVLESDDLLWILASPDCLRQLLDDLEEAD